MAEKLPPKPPEVIPPRNKGGRPRVWSRLLPPIRVRRDLFVRLERRMGLIQARTGKRNVSEYMRRALVRKLDEDDAVENKPAPSVAGEAGVSPTALESAP